MAHDPEHDHAHDHDHGDDGHGHGHGHHHGPGHVHVHVAPGKDPRRALIIALVLNGVFLLCEAGVGLWSGSLALLSDAAHMLSDVAALALALAAAQLARMPRRGDMTFGLQRAEVLGAFTNAVILVLACGWIAWEGVERLIGGAPEVPGWPVLIVGTIGLAINLGSALALWLADRDNLNIRAALVHMLADALGSVGAIAAAGLLLLGWSAADAWISLGIAALVLWTTRRVLVDSARVLLELPPRGIRVDDVREALLADERISEVHDLHVWSVDGTTVLVSAHLVSDAEPGSVLAAAQARLFDLRIAHATLQVESVEVDCQQADCGASAAK